MSERCPGMGLEMEPDADWNESNESLINSQLSNAEAKSNFLSANPKPSNTARLESRCLQGSWQYRWNER